MSAGVPQQKGSSLRESLELLHTSVHLGVVTADEQHVIDANDCFLRMIKYTRQEMQQGLIDWRAITPERFRGSDDIALQQLREYGASVPFEKEFILRDATHVPVLMGGIRSRTRPLEWVCYVFNLTDRKRAEQAERNARYFQARSAVVNEIAHALNNPLEALTLLVHALQLRTQLQTDEEACKMLSQAEGMLKRLATLTDAVLAAAVITPKDDLGQPGSIAA